METRRALALEQWVLQDLGLGQQCQVPFCNLYTKGLKVELWKWGLAAVIVSSPACSRTPLLLLSAWYSWERKVASRVSSEEFSLRAGLVMIWELWLKCQVTDQQHIHHHWRWQPGFSPGGCRDGDRVCLSLQGVLPCLLLALVPLEALPSLWGHFQLLAAADHPTEYQ